jgi:hypothetical protein
MFESHKAAALKVKDQTLAQDQPVQDFLQLWAAMKAELKDKTRIRRLEIKVDEAWRGLAQDHKDAAWMICFPEHQKIREVFEAHAVKIRG